MKIGEQAVYLAPAKGLTKASALKSEAMVYKIWNGNLVE
jgi:hypothetical protein